MSETIRVRAADPDNRRVVLWELADEHPGGEAFVTKDHVVEVAPTAEVERRLAKGLLVRVSDPATATAVPDPGTENSGTAGETSGTAADPTSGGPPAPVAPPVPPTDPGTVGTGEDPDATGASSGTGSTDATDAADGTDATATAEVWPEGVTEEQRAALAAAGYDTLEKVRAASDAELDAVKGIGPSTIARFRVAPPETPEG